MTNEDIANGHQFVINEPQSEHRVIIKVVGVGGGGNNAINHMYRKNVKDVSFVVCHGMGKNRFSGMWKNR